jgi:predicted RNA-binding Zn ribbon-like protein
MLSLSDVPIVANRLCIDFLNTEVILDGKPLDLLSTYRDLVAWARRAGALDHGEAEFVLERWAEGPEADQALASARVLRSQLRQSADRAIRRETLTPHAIEAINHALKNRPGYLQVEPAGTEWAARWKVPLRRPDDVLWRIARSAASLLADDDLSLIKRCERSSCGLYFYDNTKNHRKRWCRMDVCGAAVRSAAYYARRKGNG